ncbi:MAG: TetR/AcrR family transcriptional regulator [Streptomycetaceae bacterium]|nr:TetR/AcrR family transcriptional regulator [Streptomycetaceae bacterium]
MPPAVTPRRRGPYAKTAGVRQKIVDAATLAFAESGFHGTTMAAVARRAGISHTGLLHHFATKEELLVAVLRGQDQRSHDYLEAHRAIDPEANPLDMLSGMLAIAVEECTTAIAGASAVLLGEAVSPDHPAHSHFAERYKTARRFYTRVYTALAQRDALRTRLSPETLADITTAFLDGLRTRHLFAPADIDIAAVVHDFVDSLILTPAAAATRPPH